MNSFNSTDSSVTDIPLMTRKMSMNQKVALIIFMISLSIFGTIFNLLVLLVYRKKRNQNASLFLLFTLASVDFLVSLLVVPVTLLEYFQYFHSVHLFCRFTYFSRYTATSLSVCLLGLVAFERYYTITSKSITSLQKTQLILVRKNRIAIAIILVLCIFYGSGCFFVIDFECDFENHEDIYEVPKFLKIYNYTGMSFLMLILSGVTLLYLRTYCIVKRSSNKVIQCTKTFEYTKNNVKQLFFEAKTKNEESFMHHVQGDKNVAIVSTIDHLNSVFTEKAKLKDEESAAIFQMKKKVTFNPTLENFSVTKTYDYDCNSVEMHAHLADQSSCRKMSIYLGTHDDPVDGSKLETSPQYIEDKNKIFDIQNVNNTKQLITAQNNKKMNILNIKVMPKTDNCDEETKDIVSEYCKYKIATNSSIRKDWKIAKIFVLVNFFNTIHFEFIEAIEFLMTKKVSHFIYLLFIYLFSNFKIQ